jgi:hypothetical protein
MAIYESLPHHFVYYIWWVQNMNLFQEKKVSIEVLVVLIEKLTK